MGGSTRPRSAIYSSPLSTPSSQPAGGHARGQSFSTLNPAPTISRGFSGRPRADSKTTPAAGTFAPDFIKQEEKQRAADQIKSIEGDNDFSGKRYVWVKDPVAAFVKGWVVEETADGQLLIQCDDGSVSIVTLGVNSPSACLLVYPLATGG
jgi:myosin heavy chain 9/10/11/14